MNKSTKVNNKGITLIALVVTVIVLMILAAVSINIVANSNNGLVQRAQESSEETKKAQIYEEMVLETGEFKIEKTGQKKYDEINLENLSTYLLNKKSGLEVVELTSEKLVVKYKGYNIEIDNKLQVKPLVKMDIVVSNTLEPTTITNDSVIINLDIQLEKG